MTLVPRAFILLVLFIAAPVFASTPPVLPGEFENVIGEASKEISNGGNLPCAYNRRGIAYLKLGDYEKAVLDLQKVRQFERIICQDGDRFYGVDIGKIHYYEGVCWYYLNNYEGAIESCQRAVATDGFVVTSQFYYVMGRSYSSLLMWEDAIAAYTQAIDLDAKYAPAYHARGVAYGRIGIEHKERQDKSYARYLEPDLTFERDREITYGLAMTFGVLVLIFLFVRIIGRVVFKTTEVAIVKARPSYLMCFLIIPVLSVFLYFGFGCVTSANVSLFFQDPQAGSKILIPVVGSLLSGLMYVNLALKEFIVTDQSLYLRSLSKFGRMERIELTQVQEVKTISTYESDSDSSFNFRGNRDQRWPHVIARGVGNFSRGETKFVVLIQLILKSGKRYRISWLHNADDLVDKVNQLLQKSDTAQVDSLR